MKKITWIVSYPKSGNTYVRMLLSSFFFTNDGRATDFSKIQNIFSMNHYNIYKTINNFPTYDKLIENPQEICEYWIGAQEILSNKIKNNLFVKTHNCMAEILKKYFTNEIMTKCFIYVVRDPRSVAVSYKHHFDVSYDKAIQQLNNKNLIGFEIANKKVPELVSSWNIHYNSWKQFLSKGNGILIKYEDLVNNTEETFIKILYFLKNYINFDIDKDKLMNTLSSTTLSSLRKIEDESGFIEKPKITKNFFRKGLVDEWKTILNKSQIEIIEKNFYKEMKELGYL